MKDSCPILTFVIERLIMPCKAGYAKVKFQAEDPDNPKVASVMQRLEAKGLPTYVILKLKQ